ncbi:MAG: hypothetical protein ACYC1P_08360 [Gaiellaceae bacterium]
MGGTSLWNARRLRLAAVALLLAWFFVGELRRAVPIWIPFVVLAGLELNYLVGGLRERGAPRRQRGRPPQARDVEELGGEEWLDPVLVEVAGHDVWVPAEVAERQPPRKQPPPRRVARFEGIAVLAVLAVLLFVLLPDRGWRGLDEADQARTQALLSAEAGRIAGRTVRVRCDAEGEAVGVVQHADGIAEVGGTNALLTPAICFRLHRLAVDGDEGSFGQTARAIAVLAHEAWHLRGERDEGVVNCLAYQSGVELGRRLGLSEGTAARMMRQQLAENATVARQAPEYLVPAECRNGGRLDLNPSSERFP